MSLSSGSRKRSFAVLHPPSPQLYLPLHPQQQYQQGQHYEQRMQLQRGQYGRYQQEEQSNQQEEQPNHKPPPYLLPDHHESNPNLDFMDPIYRPIFDFPAYPPSLTAVPMPMDNTHQGMEQAVPPIRKPSRNMSIAKSTHSDNCSSCCDSENCIEGCENEDCTDGCEYCVNVCHVDIAHCSLDECKGSPCSPVPIACPQGLIVPCQTIVCEDTVCSVETAGACAVECVDEYCPEAICKDDCHTQKCTAACPISGCVEIACHDYSCSGTEGFQLLSHPPNYVSYHINNANSNRWQEPHNYQPQAMHYSSIAPNSLSLSTNYHLPPLNSFVDNQMFGDYNGFGSPTDLKTHYHPEMKRRKVSDATTITTPAFDHSYSTTPSSAAPTPLTSAFEDPPFSDSLYCLWDEGCDRPFQDNEALQEHIQHTHIEGNSDLTRCLWDGCGQESTDPNSLFNHIKTSHAPPVAQHICLWGGCNAILGSEDELRAHINTHLSSANQCKWSACDVSAPAADLQHHVRTQHLVHQPTPSPPSSSGVKRCMWQDFDSTGPDGQATPHLCGAVFENANDLQQHAKDVHISALRKKTGYHCRWAGCTRDDKPFSQKGKVERHLQTHTGYKSCTCNVCGKEFSAPQALQQHIRTHTGEKPYRCDICGKEFAQGSAMTMHKRVHSGERPLMCDWEGCGKRFSESSNLSKHRKTHNAVGQHRCGFPGCDRSFHRLDQMKRHYKTHESQKSDCG